MKSFPSGLYWLHCDGPDGRVVLLGRYDDRKQTVVVIDDACTEYILEGCWLHKWRIFAVTEVERPIPLTEGLASPTPSNMPLVRVRVDERGAWCWDPSPNQIFDGATPTGRVPADTTVMDSYGVEVHVVE